MNTVSGGRATGTTRIEGERWVTTQATTGRRED
jgi:hypothetical protein